MPDISHKEFINEWMAFRDRAHNREENMSRSSETEYVSDIMELPDLMRAIENTVADLDKQGDALKTSAMVSANARASYSEVKHRELIAMKAEEIETKTKRTIQDREALYRNKFSNERREWMMAEADHDSNKDLYRGTMSKLNALQSLLRVKEGEMRMANYQ